MTKKEKMLGSDLVSLPGISNRVGNRLPWTYSSELTIRRFFDMCGDNFNPRTINGIKVPRIRGIGEKGFQEIRDTLLKAGFKANDSAFLRAR